MPLMKFQTVGREEHRHGRVAVLLDADANQKKAFVHILEARDLFGPYSGKDAMPEHIHFRVQLLPSQNNIMVTQSLSKPRPRISNYKRQTTIHFTTGNPEIDQDFVFDLTDCWSMLSDFRLYVAVMIGDPSKGEHELRACTSFSMDDVFGKTHTARPRWWWLMSEAVGLYKNIAVEQMVVASDPVRLKPDVYLEGRIPELPNSHINGIYTWQTEICNNKPTYKQQNASLWIYYHQRKEAWCVGDCIKSPSPLAYVEDQSPTPDRAMGMWLVYSKGKQMRRLAPQQRGVSNATGKYVHDAALVCKRRSAVGLVQPVTERGKQIVRLLASQEQFTESIQLLKRYKVELENVLLDDDYPGGHAAIFDPLENLERFSNYFYEQLVRGQATDPRFDEPIGELMAHVVRSMRVPFTDYCKDIAVKVDVITRLAFYPQGDVSNLADDITRAFEAPFLQVQRYPHFVAGIMRASEYDTRPSTLTDVRQLKGCQIAMQSIVMDIIRNSGGQGAAKAKEEKDSSRPLVDPQAPVWFHGVLTTNETAELLRGKPHGTFLIRQRPDMHTMFAMGLVYKGTVSNHLISRDDETGIFTINNVDFGGIRSLVDLVDKLRIPQPDWPCRLRSFVHRVTANAGLVAIEEKRAAEVLNAAGVDPSVPDKDTPMVNGEITNPAGSTFVNIFFERGPDGYGFSFVGPKRHEQRQKGIYITGVDPEGQAAAAGMIVGYKVKSCNDIPCDTMLKTELTDLINGGDGKLSMILVSDVAGFEKYNRDVLPQDSSSPSSFSPILSSTPTSAMTENHAALKIQAHVRGHLSRKATRLAKEETDAAIKIQAQVRGHLSRKSSKRSAPALWRPASPAGWLHPARLSQADVEKLLQDEHGAYDAGVFIIRPVGLPSSGEYMLSLVHPDQQPRHHVLVPRSDGVYTVDGNTYGTTTFQLNDLVSVLSTYEMSGVSGFPQRLMYSVDCESGEYIDFTSSDPVSDAPVDVKNYEVGDRVTVEGYDGCEGIVRFIGNHHEKGKPRIGVELDQPIGTMRGTLKGHEYFKCTGKGKTGVLVLRKKVRRVSGNASTGAAAALVEAVAIKASNLELCRAMFKDQITMAIGKVTSEVIANFSKSFGENFAPTATFMVNPTDAPPGPSFTGDISKGIEVISSSWKDFINTDAKNVSFTPNAAGDEITVIQRYKNHISDVHGVPIDGTQNTIKVTQRCSYVDSKVISWIQTFDVGVVNNAKANAASAQLLVPPVTVAADTAASLDAGDEFADMKRLQLIKFLRGKNVDYSDAPSVEALRVLARSTVSGTASETGISAPVTASDTAPVTASDTTPVIASDKTVSTTKITDSTVSPTNIGDEYDNMKRLGLIKLLRERGVDYSNAKDIAELRALCRSNETNSATPTPAAPVLDSPTEEPSKARTESATGDEISVDVVKAKDGFGMSLVGPARDAPPTDCTGVYVSRIKEGGAAASSGKIKEGMKIVKVNGESVIKSTRQGVVDILKHAAPDAASGEIKVKLTFKVDTAGWEATSTGKKGSVKGNIVPTSTPTGAASILTPVDLGTVLAPTDQTIASKAIEVPLKKGADGLGMTLIGPAAKDERRHGVFVSKLKEGGVAAAASSIKVGMRIVAVNGVNTTSITRSEMVKMLKEAPDGTINFSMVSDDDGFAKQTAVSSKGSSKAKASIGLSRDQVATASISNVSITPAMATDSGERAKVEAKTKTPALAGQEPTTQVNSVSPAVNSLDPSSMGRLACIKVLRAKKIDYSNQDLEGLRALVAANQ